MDAKQREERRMEAVKRLRAGESAPVVAVDLGLDPSTVYRWGKQARLGGKKALKAVPKSGRPLKLDRTHWAGLRRMILKGPKACGLERELWTLPLVRELIQREFGVDYHDDHLSKFIRRLGLSVQRPMVRARERDERAIKRFVQVEFPAIEKKRADAAPR
jgi:transposase